MKAIKSIYGFDFMDESFNGYSMGNTWNGFECPLFDLNEALRVLSCLYNYDCITDYWMPYDSISFIDNDGNTETIEPTEITYNGKQITVYGVGSFGWCWFDLNKE